MSSIRTGITRSTRSDAVSQSGRGSGTRRGCWAPGRHQTPPQPQSRLGKRATSPVASGAQAPMTSVWTKPPISTSRQVHDRDCDRLILLISRRSHAAGRMTARTPGGDRGGGRSRDREERGNRERSASQAGQGHHQLLCRRRRLEPARWRAGARPCVQVPRRRS